MSPSDYSVLSINLLRRRNGFRCLDGEQLPTIPSDVYASEDEQCDKDQDYRSSTLFSSTMLNFEMLANMVKEMNNAYFLELGGADGIAQLLGSSTESGIQGDAKDIENRRRAFGSNTYWRQNQQRKIVINVFRCSSRTWCLLFLAFVMWFTLTTLLSLLDIPRVLAVGTISILSLFMMVSIYMLLFLKKYLNAKECDERLTKTDEVKSNVVRDGCLLQIPAQEVVVGDLVLLKKGDRVPADGVSVRRRNGYFMNSGAGFTRDEKICMLVTSSLFH